MPGQRWPERGNRYRWRGPRYDIPERRPALIADVRRAPIAVGRMDEATRQRFDAHLALFFAAVELTRASTASAAYGVPVPRDVLLAWESARDEYDFHMQSWRAAQDALRLLAERGEW